ncbi:MAG: four helix bundle protein, partial [Planctomycetota bacterium]
METPTSKSQIPMSANVDPNSNEKPFDLGERCVIFAKRILDICEMLPDTPECRRIRGQLGGAGTAVGANYEEGDGALTKKDKRKSFVHSRKEARESRFFLRVISGKYLPVEEV